MRPKPYLAIPALALLAAGCAADDSGGFDLAAQSGDAFDQVGSVEAVAMPADPVPDVPEQFLNLKQFSRLVGVGKTPETLVVGLDGRLRVFRDEDFSEELARFEGKPRSLLQYRNGDGESADWLDNYKRISVLGTRGPKLRVNVDGEVGWIQRSAVKFNHAPFIVTRDGRFVADVFTDRLTYKGNRIYSWFIEENSQPVLVVRLADPDGSPADDRYLKYKFDPSGKRFTEVRISKTPLEKETSATVWEMLDREKRQRFVADTGYRKPLPAQDDDGMLLVDQSHDLPLNPETPAIRIGNFIYVNF